MAKILLRISQGDDGINIRQVTRKDVQYELEHRHVGEDAKYNPVYSDHLPNVSDGWFSDAGIDAEQRVVVLLEAEVIVPRAVTTVTRYELPEEV